MFKTVLLSLALGAAATITQSSGILPIGYGFYNGGNTLIYPLSNTSDWVEDAFTLKVEAWQIPDPTTNWTITLTLDVSLDVCPTCGLEKIDMWAGNFVNGTFSGTPVLTQASVINTQTVTLWIEDNTATSEVDLYFKLTCSACLKSAELAQVTARILSTTNSRSYGAFNYKDDREADTYLNRVGEWGPTIRIDNIAATDYVVLLNDFRGADGLSDLSSGGVVFYFQRTNANWNALLMAQDNATYQCVRADADGCTRVTAFNGASTILTRLPKAEYTRGEFGDERMDLGLIGTGNWYVKPYITRSGTTSDDVEYRVRIGLNKIPSPAAGVVPSVLAVVLLAIAALFA